MVLRLCVCVSVCGHSRSHFFVDFHQIGHIRVNSQKSERVRWGSISPHPFPYFPSKNLQFWSVNRHFQSVCLKIEIHEIHKIHEIHMLKYRNPPTMYEIHCLKIKIHKVHEIHSKATLAKYRNPQTVRNPYWQGSQQTNRQLL